MKIYFWLWQYTFSLPIFEKEETVQTGMEPPPTPTIHSATSRTLQSNVSTSTATSRSSGTMARLATVCVWHLRTRCSCRRRCAGTGPRASASPGARRFANRWTFQTFNLFLRHKCLVVGTETRTNSIAFVPPLFSIFWVGGLWRVQPGGIHGVHHRWDKPGAEGWPGGEKKISLRFWPTNTSGGGWGFHPADLWHQTHHYHWAQGEARVWKSGKGSRSSAYLQHARPTSENLAKMQLSHKSGSVWKDVDSWGAVLEGHQLPVSFLLKSFFLKDVSQSSRAGPLRVCAQPFEHNPRLLRV